MAKLRPIPNLNMFAPPPTDLPAPVPETLISSPASVPIKDPCAKCGGRSQATRYPQDYGGYERYCVAGCLSEDRTDAYYFTPVVEGFAEEAEREEAKKVVQEERPTLTEDKLAPAIAALNEEARERMAVAIEVLTDEHGRMETPDEFLESKIAEQPAHEKIAVCLTSEAVEKFVEAEQQPLIETGEKWEEAWAGMPEFKQDDLAPWKSIYVHFESREDMEKFAKLVKQTITLNTRSIWYPPAEIGRLATKKYVEGPVDSRSKEDRLRNESL